MERIEVSGSGRLWGWWNGGWGGWNLKKRPEIIRDFLWVLKFKPTAPIYQVELFLWLVGGLRNFWCNWICGSWVWSLCVRILQHGIFKNWMGFLSSGRWICLQDLVGGRPWRRLCCESEIIVVWVHSNGRIQPSKHPKHGEFHACLAIYRQCWMLGGLITELEVFFQVFLTWNLQLAFLFDFDSQFKRHLGLFISWVIL
jgi:hypothetical protein